MKKINLLFTLFLVLFSFTAFSQAITQIGYYNFNGIFSMSSKPGFIIPGSGEMIDISNPSAPNLAGSVSLGGFAASVLVNGNSAYYGLGMTGKLVIADISNPSFPLQTGSKLFPAITGGIFGMAKSENVLYMAAGTAGVYSVNVTLPATITIMDSVALSNGQARDVVIAGEHAFVAHTDGLKIFDIGNPNNMFVISSIGSGYTSIDIDSVNNLVFLGKDIGGIDVFNVSNPNSPSPAFSIPNSGGTAWDVKYRDNLLYLATDHAGLFIYKVNGSTAVFKADFPNTSNGQSFAVSLQDSLILLSGLINGVAILHYDSLGIVGLVENSDEIEIVISPNPANDQFQYNLKKHTVYEIDILNVSGQIVKSEINLMENRIDISALVPGNYIVRFKTSGGSYSKKLIKE